MTVPEAATPLVQLLTPEGERVHHPDYDVEFTDEEYRGLYRDLVLVRRNLPDSEDVRLRVYVTSPRKSGYVDADHTGAPL